MSEFRIAAAQVASALGDIDRNIEMHLAGIEAAARHSVSVLVFPELSLTGYEPKLAAGLAIAPTSGRLARLAASAREHEMDVVVGAPIEIGVAKPGLGAILFTAHGGVRSYLKMHLGAGEKSFFSPGGGPLAFTSRRQTVGVAICADASEPTHPKSYADAGASIYAAGVFLNAEWYETDMPRLAAHALRNRMLVVMANHADSLGSHRSVGKSAIWDPSGALLAQACGAESCLAIATREDGAWRAEVVGI